MKRTINIIYSIYIWALLAILFFLAFLISILKSIGKKNQELIYNKVSHNITKLFFKRAGIKVKVLGQLDFSRDEPVIFISNHQSFLDINLLHSVIPVPFSFISKKELFWAPFIGWHMKLSGHLPIDRENKIESFRSLEKIVKKAQEKSIVIFPEGTRSYSGRLGNFKRGGMIVILKAGRPVIPIAINGSNKVMPKKSLLFNFFSRRIIVKFGYPIHFQPGNQTEREETIKIMNESRNILEALLNSCET